MSENEECYCVFNGLTVMVTAIKKWKINLICQGSVLGE